MLIDVLCRVSGLLHVKGTAVRPDTEFKGESAQLTTSASELDALWVVRDISRSSMTSEGWRVRALLRLYSEISLRFGKSDILLGDNILNIPTMNLLLGSDRAFKAFFLIKEDRILPAFKPLLESFKEHIASTYIWGGNEMTVVAAMTIVKTYLSQKDTIEFDAEMANLVMQVYRWIIKVAVNRELSSANARIQAAKFLRDIAHLDGNYGNEASLESSPGDLLIQMLRDTNIRVKFDLAEHIQQTFLCFPVAHRVKVYGAIVDNLESDEKFSEGFALRAYTLMRLALTSDDIRRAAMVNLLELGNFVSCQLMVRACFVHIARNLYQGRMTDLFTQNSCQFIYSWIEFEEDIFQFPYHVFGFVNYHQWISSVQSELIPQLVNADRWDEAANLYRSFAPLEAMLVHHLPQIISYALLQYPARTDASENVSRQCEAALGSAIFRNILTSNFAHSMSIMIERLDDKTLSGENFQSAGLASSSAILSALDLPDPGPTYPDPPQPFFSMLRVLAAIEGLRHIANISQQRLWSPPHVVYVVRNLMSHGSSASDTTVALSYLRRIAFVICVARDAVLTGYPLDMLVAGLCEFASRASVCREATTIIRYLFSQVSDSVSTPPPQVRYMTTMVLSSMEELSNTSASRETDEIVATVYDWLETLLQTVFLGSVELQSTVQLLHALNNHPSSDDITVCQIMENLIKEDGKLWGEPKLRQFSLRFLSKLSNPVSERLSALTYVVRHYFVPLNALTKLDFPAKSKIWLGHGLGRISRDSQFRQPEYRSLSNASRSYKSTGSSSLFLPEILDEILHFIRLNSRIAGLLEQCLRSLPVDTTSRLSTRFNIDNDILKYLLSPNVESQRGNTDSGVPSPLELQTWIGSVRDFTSWYKTMTCSIAQHLPDSTYSILVPAIDASMEFCESVFPFLVDEYRSQRRYDGALTEIFNSILKDFKTYDREYLMLVIRTILFLRERSPKPLKTQMIPLVDDINYFHAANAAVACRLYKTAFMFLEIACDGKANYSEVEKLLSEIYCNVDDPDLSYALVQGVTRSWNQLIHVYELHHDLEAVNDLRRARLRGKVELGLYPSAVDDDLHAVADQIRQNGFPLNMTNMLDGGDHGSYSEAPASDIYKSAWRLGNWDLPPSSASNDPDSLIYTVLYELVHSNITDQFFATLNHSITRAVDRFADNLNPTGRTKMAVCLTMLADIFEIFSAPDASMASEKAWSRKLVTHAEYGRSDAF